MNKEIKIGIAKLAWKMAQCVVRGMNSIQRRLDVNIKVLAYSQRLNDVFIVTYPKSGTTWLQMIMYQLTTDGGMEFDHIEDIIPYFERTSAHVVQGMSSRRTFKTHLSYAKIPKSLAKYIYVYRNIGDVLVSFYHHAKTYDRFSGTFDDFFALHKAGRLPFGSWSDHVGDWLKNRRCLNVLYLSYEDLISDPEGEIRKIIEFCGLDIPMDQLTRTLERSQFDFMKKHEDKFDEATYRIAKMKLATGKFIRQGIVGSGKFFLSEEQSEYLEKEYISTIDIARESRR